jgi:hypothetical protein
VRTLVDEGRQRGEHSAVFDAGGLPAGAYRCILHYSGGIRAIGLIVLR